MTKLLLIPFVLLASSASAAPKLPPAHPVAFEEPDTKAVMIPINAIFVAAEKGDAVTLLTFVYPDGRVTATGTRASGVSGVRSESWTQFAKRITPETAFEESLADPAIEIDGDVAMVWGRFVVRKAGKVNNCGFDHFDLVRENDIWKVMNLSFSSHITDCGN